MNPFPVKASYGANKEYRDFVQIEGDIGSIPLHVTDKTETKAPARMGEPYQEAGGWATLREIRQNAQNFVELAEADQTQDRERLLDEAYYQKSIADWMESAEAALVGTLRKSGTSITTSTTVDPAKAMRQTGATVESSGRFESP